MTADGMYSGAMYKSAAIKNAARRRSKRFMRRELERPLAAAPEAAWLSSSATKRCLAFAASGSDAR